MQSPRMNLTYPAGNIRHSARADVLASDLLATAHAGRAYECARFRKTWRSRAVALLHGYSPSSCATSDTILLKPLAISPHSCPAVWLSPYLLQRLLLRWSQPILIAFSMRRSPRSDRSRNPLGVICRVSLPTPTRPAIILHPAACRPRRSAAASSPKP